MRYPFFVALLIFHEMAMIYREVISRNRLKYTTRRDVTWAIVTGISTSYAIVLLALR